MKRERKEGKAGREEGKIPRWKRERTHSHTLTHESISLFLFSQSFSSKNSTLKKVNFFHVKTRYSRESKCPAQTACFLGFLWRFCSREPSPLRWLLWNSLRIGYGLLGFLSLLEIIVVISSFFSFLFFSPPFFLTQRSVWSVGTFHYPSKSPFPLPFFPWFSFFLALSTSCEKHWVGGSKWDEKATVTSGEAII